MQVAAGGEEGLEGGRVVVAWEDAPGTIASMVSPRAGGPVVIGVGGPVGAGKSALASRLGGCVLATDDYLPDYSMVEYERRDLPESADFERLVRDLASLRAGRGTRVPVWSFQTHRREGERDVSPPGGGVIIVEGIHALHGTIRGVLDLAVFVAAGQGVRWERWAHLERTGARGWGEAVAREYFERVAEPTFARYQAEYLASAQVVVLNEHGRPGVD
jgi:uridine kinase